MTNEEAKKILLSDADFSGIGKKAKKTADALVLAVEALEKRTMKKPYAIEDETYGEMKICPVCSYRVIKGLSNYCLNCGQAIDWNEVDKGEEDEMQEPERI